MEELDSSEKMIKGTAAAFAFSGLQLYEQKLYIDAADAFTKAIATVPNYYVYYTMRGTVYEDMGNNFEAAAAGDFSQALKLNPNDFVAAFRIGMLYNRKKDNENAIKWLKVAFNNSIDEDLSYFDVDNIFVNNNNIFFVHKKIIAGNLGNILTQLGKFEEGVHYLDLAIDIDPKYANPYLSKGIALVQIGKPREGLINLKQAAELGEKTALMIIKMLQEDMQAGQSRF